VPTVPASPFAPVAQLFLSPGDSDLQAFLRQAHDLLARPENAVLLEAAQRDLDAHALHKKQLRKEDARWHQNRTAQLAGMPPVPAPPQPLVLLPGRPRTPAYVVLMTLLLRGYFGTGFKACDADSMLQESLTLRVFFTNLGMEIPGRSTLTELVNAISNQTRRLLLDAQAALVKALELDDFFQLIQDSTHVAANSEWPTDSRLVIALVGRILRVGGKLDRLGLPLLQSDSVEGLLKRIVRLNREIEFSLGKMGGKRARERRYRQLLWRAALAHQRLDELSVSLPALAAALEVPPSRRERAVRVVALLRADLDSLAEVLNACNARVLNQEKVDIADKVLSTSDPDAGFIKKGQRDPVIGYKPQLALSEQGFITGFLLPHGNAADSKKLIPMIEQVSARTKVVPFIVNVDDGYASIENKRKAKALGVTHVVIGGAKGRALTSDAAWNSPLYVETRGMRSAVESLMFTIKQGFHFGEVARRGLQAATADLLEKVLAYNICKIVSVRAAKEEAEVLQPDLAAAA
jgi:IS5 family transposase